MSETIIVTQPETPAEPEAPVKSLTILDTRVPQPGHYDDYDVPAAIAAAADCLLAARNTVPDDQVGTIDAALIRLLQPWTQEASR